MSASHKKRGKYDALFARSVLVRGRCSGTRFSPEDRCPDNVSIATSRDSHCGTPLATFGQQSPRIPGSSGLLLVLPGGYLTNRMSAWSLAWPKVALAALILIGILGAVTSKRMSATRRICAVEKTNESECAAGRAPAGTTIFWGSIRGPISISENYFARFWLPGEVRPQ
jgi:hypothetical protein